MVATLQDRQDIAELMTGWIHRDLGHWDRLLGLFHPGGTVEITWFQGLATDFVEGSRRMGASDLRTKHVVAQPVIRFNGPKAVVETNAMVMTENVRLDLGCTTHNRFFDRVEKRDDHWKIVSRQCIYDMAGFSFPFGPVEIDTAAARRFPREYAPLAYLLDVSGFPLRRTFATKGSELESTMKQEAEAWLQA